MNATPAVREALDDQIRTPWTPKSRLVETIEPVHHGPVAGVIPTQTEMRSFLSTCLTTSALLAWCAGPLPLSASTVTYYISYSGSDSNTGTSPGQAWQTLGRLDQVQYALQPGDHILLEKGGTYRGTLPLSSSGTAAAPIVVGAYGNGDAPIVSGSTLVTGWQPYQGTIWSAPVAGIVKQVYVNGQFMTLARYPNTGWLRMDQGTSTTLHDDDLSQPAGYWNGATAVIRASNWNYDLAPVTGFSNGILTFPTIYDQPGNYQWGYFICNKLSELDAPGEWYYDSQAGILYMQAPGNVDPNSLQVEASTLESGAYIAWNREHIQVQGLAFEHQTVAGVKIGGGHNITVTGCSFRNAYHGVASNGSNNSILNSTFTDILASGIIMIDDNSTCSGNQLSNIALVPGSGETSWGYFGIRAIGSDNTISDNRLDQIGYIGITVDNNSVVERNVIQNCLATLNDGGGIAFDNTDGAIIKDNIITDITGNLESSAPDFPNYTPISFGIYFGNSGVTNTLIQHNTVTRCAGSGIHVDHTMASTGNAIKDNVLFNNGIQLSISDWSNNAGPAAVPPYYIPVYNEVYSGNVMYSLTRDQICMRQYNCHSTQPVDFGTFSNNRYFNPYNELDIFLANTFSGTYTYYTLENWQQNVHADIGSTRSPLRLNDNVVTATTGDELVGNGTFPNNVDGWGGWPTNAQVTHDMAHLDDGALKANLPDASVYPQFFMQNPLAFPVENGKWYRMSFSLQSDIQGRLNAAVKGLSQMTGLNTIGKRDYPFSDDRRDVDFIFHSELTDQAVVQFTNNYQNPHYWLDNVSVKEVQVQSVDPDDKQVLIYNDQEGSQTFPLEGCWSDVDGNYHNGALTLPGFRSMVLVKEADESCNNMTTGTEEVLGSTPGTAYPNPAQPGAWLHLTGNAEGPFLVWAMNGRLVYQSELDPSTNMVLLPTDITPGAYMVAVGEEGNIQRFKLMVQ